MGQNQLNNIRTGEVDVVTSLMAQVEALTTQLNQMSKAQVNAITADFHLKKDSLLIWKLSKVISLAQTTRLIILTILVSKTIPTLDRRRLP